MENQRFSQRGTSLGLSLRVHERTKAGLLPSLSKQHTTSTGLVGKPVQGYKVSRPLIVTSGVVGRTDTG